MPVHPVRHLAQPGTGVGDHEHRQPAPPGGGPAARVGEDGHGTDPGRVLAEIGPVVMAAGQGRVQVAGPDAARVVGDAGHHQRAAGPGQRVQPRPGPAMTTPSSPASSASGWPGACWTQIREHGQRLPLITVR